MTVNKLHVGNSLGGIGLQNIGFLHRCYVLVCVGIAFAKGKYQDV